MKLVVFGTTGGVGREVVRQALEVGHTVTAVVRDPAKLSAQARSYTPISQRPTSTCSPTRSAPPTAVISAVGPTGRTDAGIAARATATIADAMEIQGVRRGADTAPSRSSPT